LINECRTALLCACLSENVEIVKYLFEHGADINKKSFFSFDECKTPLFCACSSGDVEIVKYLV